MFVEAAFPKGDAAFLFVRPAWARSWRCKSSRELTTASEVKRNCVRVTERGEEAWSKHRASRNTNRIGGGAGQGERASDREALVVKAQAT
jgi:hypothetical protein